MSIADKITSIETHLQADWESIENIGGTAEDKNIENIASVVNGIYDNLPKTTGEDTSLSLTTLKGKMNIIPKGDTIQDGTPTPSAPIDIEVVTGTQEVKVENVNLLDISQENINIGGATSTIAYDDEGYMTITNNNSSASYINIPIASDVVDIGSPYTLKVEWGTSELTYIYLQNSNDDYSKYVYTTTTTTATNTAISNFLKVLILVNANKTIKVRVQVQKGNTISGDYTPHQEQTQVVSLGNIELCKIGNYQDYLYKSNDKWYKKEYIGKYNLANMSNMSHPSNWANQTAFLSPNQIQHGISGYGTKADLYCNRFLSAKPSEIANTTENVIGLGDNHSIYFSITGITTSSGYTTYFQNNETILYYILATPNDIEITNTNLIEQLDNLEKLKSYNGTTNISSSGSLPMVLSVSALKGE